jgi:hypothetical protein
VEAFQVVVVCHETPPARRIRRSVSRLMATTATWSSKCSRSLTSDQVAYAMMPRSAGDIQAIR